MAAFLLASNMLQSHLCFTYLLTNWKCTLKITDTPRGWHKNCTLVHLQKVTDWSFYPSHMDFLKDHVSGIRGMAFNI